MSHTNSFHSFIPPISVRSSWKFDVMYDSVGRCLCRLDRSAHSPSKRNFVFLLCVLVVQMPWWYKCRVLLFTGYNKNVSMIAMKWFFLMWVQTIGYSLCWCYETLGFFSLSCLHNDGRYASWHYTTYHSWLQWCDCREIHGAFLLGTILSWSVLWCRILVVGCMIPSTGCWWKGSAQKAKHLCCYRHLKIVKTSTGVESSRFLGYVDLVLALTHTHTRIKKICPLRAAVL